MWAILLKLCICSNFASTQLMNDQIQERANDQKAIAHACSVALKTLETHSFTLYFHASYEPDTHSKNSPLRHLILSAQKLLITLGGCKETMMIFKPLLLVKTAKLRRDAYRYLIHAIDEVCLINDDVDSNSNFLSFIFLSIDFQTDHWNTHSVYASIPDITSFQKAAPPPPMPSLSTIRTALELLFSKNVDLSFAAGRFITNILVQFYLKARERKFVCVDWRSVEIPKKCEGFENECQYDCLASKNYTLRNHILSLVESPNYFRSTSVWVDPCSCAMFPSFPDSDENTLKADISDNEWLKFRSEIDLSELTHSEISDWRKGIKTIAEFFAKPDSWTQLSQVFLSYHRCSSKNLTKILKLLIQFVLLSFGPHPYLQRVEEFVMTLLQPALTPGPKNDMVMIVGSTLANEILFYVAVGSCSWPRDMKLELFRRVLPRLIFYAEAGSQRASMSAGSTVILSIPLCLNNVSFLQPTNYDAATANESNSYFQEENEVSPANCPLAYAIRYGDWERDEIDSSKEMDVPDPYGPNTQIRSPISEFLRNITTDSIVTAYFPYIWKCISQLASVGNVEHVSIVGDLQCDHNVPGDNGECPICVGCRLFSRVGQRRALKDKMMVEFLNVTHWNKIHLLKHLTDMRMEFWEKKVCGNSLWSQQQAMTVSNSFARAEFNKIRNTAPPTIRYYKIDDTNGDAPKFSEHQAQSA
ncbi:unnamed protein product, partial [Hymenolepis diminuta]|uniref:BLM10_mid domain-containing protein n=2 Tax=Hymenolepis diminuta TaxID=6216 RepID=A0A0R3SMT7_HYMDI